MARRPNTQGGRGSRIVGALDVGTSKTVCVIAEVAEGAHHGDEGGSGPIRVLGLSAQRSWGVKAGVVIDLARAEETTKSVIAKAEDMAGVTLSEITCSVSCGRLKSVVFTARVRIEERHVVRGDLSRLARGARAYAERDGRAAVHLNRLGWRLDGELCPHSPIGMPGETLAADMHAVTADEPPLRNLLLLVEGCYVSVSGLVATPYASALSATTEEERRLGVTVIDIGGGTTTMAQFVDGHLVLADSLPVGGSLVSADIARALHTPFERAERIKTLYGTLVPAPSDEHEVFSYPLTGEEEGETHRTTKAHLAEIIQARTASTLDLAGERLALSAGRGPAGGHIVLTGGASQTTGMAEFASHRLGVPVRVGGPQSWPGLPIQILEPQFATVTGLLLAATRTSDGVSIFHRRQEAQEGYLERVGKWLRQGF